jgi:hypothetical protein
MKKNILVLLFAFFTVSLYAQSKNTLIFGDALLKYKRMETTGTVLTVVGGLALFTGNILYWKSFNDHDNGEPVESKARTYKDIMFGGLGLMAVGIPLLASGKSKERHIIIEAELLKFNSWASVNGVGLKIRF